MERWMSFYVILVLYVCLVLAGYHEDSEQCDSSDGCTCHTDHSFIDISHSFNYPITDITDSVDYEKYIYQFSPCARLTDCNPGNETAAVCQVLKNSTSMPITLGLISGAIWTVESVDLFTVSYTGGELTFDGFKRQAQVHFTVETSASFNSIIFLGSKRNNLDKIINYNFQVTLTGGRGQSLAGIAGFAIIALVIVVVSLYLAIGSVYKYTVNHARGVQVIPHYAFWNEFPRLVKDGCCFVLRPCKFCLPKNDFGKDAYHSF